MHSYDIFISLENDSWFYRFEENINNLSLGGFDVLEFESDEWLDFIEREERENDPIFLNEGHSVGECSCCFRWS